MQLLVQTVRKAPFLTSPLLLAELGRASRNNVLDNILNSVK